MNQISKVDPFQDSNQMSIPELLKSKRANKGMTQKELAEQAGLSLSAIKQYETGRSEPTLAKIKAIAKVLDISTDDLSLGLNVGTVGDDRLRLAVLQEATAFITGDASRKQLEQVRSSISEMMGIDPVADQTALAALQDMIDIKGIKSRAVIKAIGSAKDYLDVLDWDELVEEAEELGLFLEESGTDENDEDAATDRILVTAIYGTDLMARSLDELKAIRSWINSYNDDEDIVEGIGIIGAIGEAFGDSEDYQNRLKSELPRHILARALKRSFLPEIV